MDENFRQRHQKLPGGVVQVDAPRGSRLWFALLALFAAVADTDGQPRIYAHSLACHLEGRRI